MSGARQYPFQRAIRTTLRTVHLVTMALLLGAVYWGVNPGAWGAGVLLSGLGIAADDFYKHRADWFRFLQGWAVFVKLGLIGLGIAVPSLMLGCLLLSVVIGSVISHGPGSLRHYALWGPQGPCSKSRG